MRVIQLYEVVRTAHLERVDREHDVTVLFREKRYDFDKSIASRVRPVRAGLAASAWHALTHQVDLIEINEPLVARAAARSLIFVALARVRAFLARSPRPQVVAYAIANLPVSSLRRALPWKARVKFELFKPLTRVVWRSLDRVAFGTRDAEETYRAEFSAAAGPRTALIEALPAAATLTEEESGVRKPVLLFLGDLSPRKGFPDVLAAWADLRERNSEARLVIVGRGAGVSEATTLADRDPRVEFVHSPARDVILDHLRRAKVAVLPSRRRPLWKEQIGLPIVEGLQYGCLIATTDETGIAGWLRDAGHFVVREDSVESELTGALERALASMTSASDVQSALPGRDGRAAARDWLYDLEA